VAIWKELVESSNDNNSKYCWILEDDAVFTTTTTSRNHTNTSNNNNNSNRFISAFDKAWRQLPHDWDILYLGFSSRGERDYVHQPFDKVSQQPPYRRNNNDSHDTYDDNSFVVELYRPEYGYHTHAYVITKDAAKTLLEHLPVTGPLDVWLADNQWFQLNVYCSVIANEGWKRQDGTYEGALLVSQDRGKGAVSDVSASARRKDARV
jgi:GR25 family glycosyltransferase involved in LPS biosynthesis